MEAISEKTLRSTVALTAARGRGKSAALGIAISGAVAFGYSNIFVTSPSPENLKTLFEFVFKGFDALGYEEHLDYDIVQSVNPAFNKAVVRVNIFKEHRQTIQYIQPQDSHVLGQAELLVIDEAAAIPLPFVKALLGPYLVFLSSTVNGYPFHCRFSFVPTFCFFLFLFFLKSPSPFLSHYLGYRYEGTGRSLSLKLIQQLRESSVDSKLVPSSGEKSEKDSKPGTIAGTIFSFLFFFDDP